MSFFVGYALKALAIGLIASVPIVLLLIFKK